MISNYGRYAGERDSAWKAIIDNHITALPVDVIKIACRNKIKVIRNTEVNLLTPKEAGLCIFKDNQWYIIYDNTLSNAERRYTIAHELGHIFLGHPINFIRYKTNDAMEAAADSFATRLLSPLCVLKEIHIQTQEELKNICELPDEIAKLRFERYKVVLKRNLFYKSELEKQVASNFDNFIKYIISKKESN